MSAEYGVRSAEPVGTQRALVCFAVPEEARHFPKPLGAACQVLITGMGPAHAAQAVQRWFASASQPPFSWVLTCGFAGALDPDLRLGQVVFDADPETGCLATLTQLGARAARFHCASTIAVTAEAKRTLRAQTGADVVEMESGVIRRFCRERGILSATVRVISDEAGTDLPLDFNALARADGNLSYVRLAGALLRSPLTVRALIAFRRDLDVAGQRLGEVLAVLLRAQPG